MQLSSWPRRSVSDCSFRRVEPNFFFPRPTHEVLEHVDQPHVVFKVEFFAVFDVFFEGHKVLSVAFYLRLPAGIIEIKPCSLDAAIVENLLILLVPGFIRIVEDPASPNLWTAARSRGLEQRYKRGL